MNNDNKIENPKTEVSHTIEMNDWDYLEDMLQTEKDLANNINTSLNEASNKKIYKDFYKIYEKVRDSQRDLFKLMFKNGWYSLEKAEENKITEEYDTLSQKMNELI